MDNKIIYQKITAREILNIIEEVCFSEEYMDFRIKEGFYGQRDLLIKKIEEKYDVK